MLCLKENKRKRKTKRQAHCPWWGLPAMLVVVLLLVAVAAMSWYTFSSRRSYGYNPSLVSKSNTFQLQFLQPKPKNETHFRHNFSSSSTTTKQPNNETHFQYNFSSSSTTTKQTSTKSEAGSQTKVQSETQSPYHNWELFAADFQDMMSNFKIYVYPHVYTNTDMDPFARIFLPHPNPLNPKLGNYLSEHMFKLALLRSSLITKNPRHAHFFFLPFSINNLRNDARVRSEASIAEFVAKYTRSISRQFPFWNASAGADHFYVCCHSVGRDAASRDTELHNNAIQVTCSSSYFQKLYVTHKDVALPQVWPRPYDVPLNPPHARHRLVYFAGRIQNSRIRQELIALWGNDSSMDVFHQRPSFSYEEGFRRSKYCLHVRGYEVNTARVSDAIHYGCIPVILSNYYDLPFANVLDWSKFSVVFNNGEIPFLKKRLLSITKNGYLRMYRNLCQVRRHFVWHEKPRGFDSFHMTAYQLWLRRSVHRIS